MNSRKLIILVLGLILFFCASSGWAQSSGNITRRGKGSIGWRLDRTPQSNYRSSQRLSSGNHDRNRWGFRFHEYPIQSLSPGRDRERIRTTTQDVDVRSTVPVSLDISLKLWAPSRKTSPSRPPAGTWWKLSPRPHTDVDRDLFDKLPLESASSSVSSLVTLSTPGVAADSNGLFHGLGRSRGEFFSVDGQPITDQQSKVFSNQIPEDSIQSLEVISGAPPAEYGDKTSLVIVVTTRSGLGETEPHGQVTASYGSFGTPSGGFNLAFGRRELGQLHLRQRPEHRAVSRSSGIRRHARQWQ